MFFLLLYIIYYFLLYVTMRKIFIFVVFLLIIKATVSALEIQISKIDTNNNWFFNTFWNSNISVILTDENSVNYVNWERIKVFQWYDSWNQWHDSYINIWTWVLQSDKYGDFYLKDWNLLLENNDTLRYKCDNNVAYSYTWSFYSPSFGQITIQDWSYYCPLSGSSALSLYSDLLWSVDIDWINWFDYVTVTNSRWELVDIINNLILDDKKISINWSNNIKNVNFLSTDFSKDVSVNVDTDNKWKMANFNKSINKNLSKYTNWLTPVTTNINDLTWFGDTNLSNRIHYYDFEWQEEVSPSNKENKWIILKLWTWGSWISYNNILVRWQKLLYIKWWNLYIDADIKNASNLSQLVIVVKRDSTNRKNWGNVYIDPGVTNIDATIIADWSIMSFDWTNVLVTPDADMRNQLLIYWSISTKNTFWDDKAIYWTDDYISNWWREVLNVKQYNLANLRWFQVMLNDDVLTWNCAYNWTSKIVARSDSWTWVLEYAFVGKKKCFFDDLTNNDLRWTDKLTPLVIEYNPVLQTNPHFILQK